MLAAARRPSWAPALLLLLLGGHAAAPPGADARLLPADRAVARVATAAGDATPGAGPARSEHVVVISVDGLRPDAIDRFHAATIVRLRDEGSRAARALTILPSSTLPSHTSMLTGEEVAEHGIGWNRNRTQEHGHVAVPTVFALAHAHGLRTAAFFSKGKFQHLVVPGTLDHGQAPDGNDRWPATRTASDVERYLETARPHLLFVHIGEPDYAGHVWGWMSWAYGRNVRKADRAVARVLAAAERAYGAGNYTVILTADHGGHGWGHGSSDERDVTIPWITWGRGVAPGGTVARDVHTMDTAATALWLLGVPVPAGMAGVPVREAYGEEAEAAA